MREFVFLFRLSPCPSALSILLCFSHLSCLAPLERGRGRMERKRMTMGEAAQILYKSALPPMVYYPPWQPSTRKWLTLRSIISSPYGPKFIQNLWTCYRDSLEPLKISSISKLLKGANRNGTTLRPRRFRFIQGGTETHF